MIKILHILLGYLTVTALLHFCPFAFASPLAAISIDCDKDTSALAKRVPGDVIEARQALVIIPSVIAVIAILDAIALGIIWIEHDDTKREAFTQDTITQAFSQYPKFNWVICHSPYSVDFFGVEGTDWGYTHHELGISLGRTIGYDLYWARAGIFYRYGDGGFINWAYNGNVYLTDDDGATIYFATIS